MHTGSPLRPGPVASAGSTNTISPAGISFDATISLWDKIYHGYAEYFNCTILSYFILQLYSCYLPIFDLVILYWVHPGVSIKDTRSQFLNEISRRKDDNMKWNRDATRIEDAIEKKVNCSRIIAFESITCRLQTLLLRRRKSRSILEACQILCHAKKIVIS